MSHSQQPVRAFPINSQYKQSYRSPETSLVRNAERGLQQTVAAARDRAGYEDEPRSYRPSSASARSGVDLIDADDPFTHFQTTRSGRVAVGNGVPSLGLNHIGPAPSAKGITRPPPSVQPTPVGPTLIPDTSYRGPSGTTLNKVPYSARKRQELAEAQRATQERLREKALNKKIRDAVISEQLQRPKSAAPARRSASAKKDPDVRHAAQQFRREHSFVNAAEIDSFVQPYESIARPQSAGPARSASGPLFTANGKPIAQPGSARKVQQANFGKPQPADRVGQLVSSSSQSRLTAAELASQPTAGRPSNQGAGNDLASILGGGHEHVIFGNKNSNSAQTRKKIDAPVVDQTEWNNPRAAAQRAVQAYAPYATTTLTSDELQAPGLANDQSGAVVVRDELSRETRHAPAAIGFGKSHVGYREYVAKPAAATGIERAARDQEVGTTVDPFRPSAGNSILSWNTDGIDRNSREEDIKRMQQQLWSKTSADYGTKKGSTGQDPNLDRPVAGITKGGNREPLQLSYPAPGEVVAKHVHGPHCGHSKPRPVSASPSKNRDAPVRAFNASSGNPLNPYSSEELENLTSRPANLAAAALGFGKKHAQYKKTILHGMAPEDFIKANQ